MYSSLTSYEPIELGGGGFLGMNKDLLMGSIGTLVFLTLLIAQYYPKFDYTYKSDASVWVEVGKFLEKLEGFCHA